MNLAKPLSPRGALSTTGRLLTAAAIVVGAVVASSGVASAAPLANSISLEPARLLDTRPAHTTVDGKNQAVGTVAAGATYQLPVVGRGGVAPDASAVILNVTAVRAAAPGHLTVFPCGSAMPTASSVNYMGNDVVPNAVVAKVGAEGKVCIYTLSKTDLVVDVNGYVPAAGSPVTVVPSRLLGTRSTDTTPDGLHQKVGRLSAGQTYTLDVAKRGGVPADATGVVMNVTAVRPEAAGFLTVFPCGTTPKTGDPSTSNVNYIANSVRPNAVTSKLSAQGTVCIFTLKATDVVVDLNAYIPNGSSPFTVQPARLLGTRSSDVTVDGKEQGGPKPGAKGTIEVTVAGRAGVPADAATVLLNVTAVQPAGPGFLTVYPCGSKMPLASNVNYMGSDVQPNAVYAKVGKDGKVCIYTLESADIVVDVFGYVGPGVYPPTPYPPTPYPPAGN